MEPRDSLDGARNLRGRARVRFAFGWAIAGSVIIASFALLTATRAQENDGRYWRTNMGPSVLTAEQETEKASKPGSDFTECANGCPTMIVVPAGRFMMGSPATEADRLPTRGSAARGNDRKAVRGRQDRGDFRAMGCLRRGRSVPQGGRQHLGAR